VALDGEEIVGVTYLVRRPGGDAEVGDTGVLRSHRRRGIARALKMMPTRCAAEQGFRYVYTDNRADNAGMLAINTQLGCSRRRHRRLREDVLENLSGDTISCGKWCDVAVEMSQKMRDFAAEVYPAILGTTRKDGSVQINPVWFEYRDGSFWG